MNISPIHAAIDRATGFDREAFERQKLEQDEAASKALLDSAEAVLAWWKSKRPVKWSKARHLRAPHVNLMTETEGLLADCAVALLKAGF